MINATSEGTITVSGKLGCTCLRRTAEEGYLVLTYINWRHFVEEKSTWNDDLHVIVGADDSFIEL